MFGVLFAQERLHLLIVHEVALVTLSILKFVGFKKEVFEIVAEAVRLIPNVFFRLDPCGQFLRECFIKLFGNLIQTEAIGQRTKSGLAPHGDNLPGA